MTFRHQVCCAVLFSKSVVKKKNNEIRVGEK